MPRATVIIPRDNEAPNVTRSVRTVFDQTATDFEVIVVDGSTDDGAAMATALLPSDSRLEPDPPGKPGRLGPAEEGLEPDQETQAEFLADLRG
jgi:cellulose synthase/poly-beta-1,6-N-acetylglucosamine synthase-like glycosyltransferase